MIEGMPEAVAKALFARLLAHMIRPEFVHEHHWRPGDVLISDNRCSLHRANHAFSEGRYEDATREYQSILRKDPGNVQARNGYRRAA